MNMVLKYENGESIMPTYMTNWSRNMVNKAKKRYMNNSNSSNNGNNTNGEENTSDGNVAADSTMSPSVGSTNTAGATNSQNDPKKNRKLAELKMSEPLRELLNFELVLPGVYPGLKTNQFIWIPVKNDFYDEMYEEIMQVVGPSKFNRYSDFEKGRFYISKKTWEYDIENGVKTSLVVNPFPSMYSEYMKMQLEAERALDQAVIDATGGGGGTTNTGSMGGTAVEIGNNLASKYKFCSSVARDSGATGSVTSTYDEMKNSGCGDCWAWSDALYTELNAAGIPARIIQYNSGMTGNHRSVQIQENGQWVDYPYRSTNISKYARNTTSKGGCYVFKEPNGSGG